MSEDKGFSLLSIKVPRLVQGGPYIQPVNVLQNDIAIRILGERIRTSLPGDRPVDQERVHIIQTQIIE